MERSTVKFLAQECKCAFAGSSSIQKVALTGVAGVDAGAFGKFIRHLDARPLKHLFKVFKAFLFGEEIQTRKAIE